MEKDNIKVVYDTFQEAMDIHKKLFEAMRKNGVITYADFSVLVSEEDAVFPDFCYEYGWTNLWNVKVEPYGDDCKWVLRMPEMKLLKEKENK